MGVVVLRLVVVDEEVPVLRTVAVLIGHHNARIAQVHADRVETLVLPPEEIRPRDVALHVVLDQRQEVPLHDVVDLALRHDVARPGEHGPAGGVEVAMAGALYDGRLPEVRRPVMQVERLAKITAGGPVDVSVSCGGPQVIVGLVWVRNAGTLEIRRQHAAEQHDVLGCIVRGRVRGRVVRDSVIGDRDSLCTTTVPDPGYAVRVNVPHEDPATDSIQLIEEGVGVPQGRERGIQHTRLRIIVMTHHHVAVGGHVEADVVVPLVVVAIAAADDDQRKLAHRGDVRGVVSVLVRPAGYDAEYSPHAIDGEFSDGQRSLR